ncbi:hypothetical protein [Bradyrhizobium sp. Rc3b]|nr:hypothetical protein [Bradyrhizobium sp. Rc3b]
MVIASTCAQLSFLAAGEVFSAAMPTPSTLESPVNMTVHGSPGCVGKEL